jgi:hypothetical protein
LAQLPTCNAFGPTCNNIWKAVKIAKNQGTNDILFNHTLGNVDVNSVNIVNVFAGYFHEKIEKIKNDTCLMHIMDTTS